MEMKRINSRNILALMVAMFSIASVVGYVRPAEAQDVYSTKRLTRTDSLLTLYVAGNQNIEISVGDSSNSVADTINVYVVTPWGEEVLARLTPLNDTGAVYATKQKIGVVIPGDGSTVFYSVNLAKPYQIKLVRTNVLTGTSRVTISGYKVTGDLFEAKKLKGNNLAWQDTYEHIFYSNPGFY